MATLLKVLNNLADIKSAGVLHFASELRHSSTGATLAQGNAGRMAVLSRRDAHSGRPESTYCGRSPPRPWTPQMGGKRTYNGRQGRPGARPLQTSTFAICCYENDRPPLFRASQKPAVIAS